MAAITKSNICLTDEFCVEGEIIEALAAKIKAGEVLTTANELIKAPVEVGRHDKQEAIYDKGSQVRELKEINKDAVIDKPKTNRQEIAQVLKATGCDCDDGRAAECIVAVANKEGIITDAELIEITTTNMKQPGPRDKEWLDNSNIDSYMRLMKVMYESPANRVGKKEHGLFYPYAFNMIDFQHAKLNGQASGLATNPPHVIFATECEKSADGETLLYDTFGCVLNSDVSTGRGQHWVSFFVDLRDDHRWTVEFFNSVAEHCYPEITEFCAKVVNGFIKVISDSRVSNSGSKQGGSYTKRLRIRGGTPEIAAAIKEKTSKDIEVEFVPLCKVSHQRSSYQCGVYSIYFIYSRLLGGATAKTFMDPNHIISDDDMAKFRRAIFIEEKYIVTK